PYRQCLPPRSTLTSAQVATVSFSTPKIYAVEQLWQFWSTRHLVLCVKLFNERRDTTSVSKVGGCVRFTRGPTQSAAAAHQRASSVRSRRFFGERRAVRD